MPDEPRLLADNEIDRIEALLVSPSALTGTFRANVFALIQEVRAHRAKSAGASPAGNNE